MCLFIIARCYFMLWRRLLPCHFMCHFRVTHFFLRCSRQLLLVISRALSFNASGGLLPVIHVSFLATHCYLSLGYIYHNLYFMDKSQLSKHNISVFNMHEMSTCIHYFRGETREARLRRCDIPFNGCPRALPIFLCAAFTKNTTSFSSVLCFGGSRTQTRIKGMRTCQTLNTCIFFKQISEFTRYKRFQKDTDKAFGMESGFNENAVRLVSRATT